MKIMLLYAMAALGQAGELIIHAPGDIIELSESEAQTLIAQGQAMLIEEPDPVPAKRTTKKVL
jgi:hypothetical protein